MTHPSHPAGLERQLLDAAGAMAVRRGVVTLGVDELYLALVEDKAFVALLRRSSSAGDRIARRIGESLPRSAGSATFRVPASGARLQVARAWTDVFARAGSMAAETETTLEAAHVAAAALEVAPEAIPSRILSGAGLTPEAILRDLLSRRMPRQGQAHTPTLDRFGSDLTALAADSKLDPLVGREREVRRCLQILNRRTKNNPVLVGEPGVGKTAIVEGIAQLLCSAPPRLRRRLVTLDLARLVAGTRYRGEFEERLEEILAELVRGGGTVVVFIDELHRLIGAGAAVGAIDAASIMKPLLARGSLQVIGATTPDDFRLHIAGDRALERRFQPVPVAESSAEETLAILRGLRPRYEAFHGVKIEDAALEHAVTIAERAITGRFLPDKAIDLMDEACAAVRLLDLPAAAGQAVGPRDIDDAAEVWSTANGAAAVTTPAPQSRGAATRREEKITSSL